MGASNITTTRPSSRTWHRAVALIVATCSLTVPASAGASYGYSMPNAIIGGEAQSSGSSGGSEYSSVSSLTGSSNQPSSVSGATDRGSGYSSLNAIAGPSPSQPTLVSSPSSAADDGFDWASAGIGAGAVLGMLSLAGAVLLSTRRRTGVSPSTASMT